MGAMLSAVGSLQWYRDFLALGKSFDDLLIGAESVPAGTVNAVEAAAYGAALLGEMRGWVVAEYFYSLHASNKGYWCYSSR